MKPYSMDLRERVVAVIGQNGAPDNKESRRQSQVGQSRRRRTEVTCLIGRCGWLVY